MKTIAFFDGATEPINPGGHTGCGWVIYINSKDSIRGNKYIGFGNGMTNNVAEYHGLLNVLEILEKESITGAEIFGDSNLVVNMVNGVWGRKKPHAKFPHLQPLLFRCKELLKEGGHDLSWVPREENTEADEQSKLSVSDYL